MPGRVSLRGAWSRCQVTHHSAWAAGNLARPDAAIASLISISVHLRLASGLPPLLHHCLQGPSERAFLDTAKRTGCSPSTASRRMQARPTLKSTARWLTRSRSWSSAAHSPPSRSQTRRAARAKAPL